MTRKKSLRRLKKKLLNLFEDQVIALDKAEKITGKNASDAIREAVDDYLNKRAKS